MGNPLELVNSLARAWSAGRQLNPQYDPDQAYDPNSGQVLETHTGLPIEDAQARPVLKPSFWTKFSDTASPTWYSDAVQAADPKLHYAALQRQLNDSGAINQQDINNILAKASAFTKDPNTIPAIAGVGGLSPDAMSKASQWGANNKAGVWDSNAGATLAKNKIATETANPLIAATNATNEAIVPAQHFNQLQSEGMYNTLASPQGQSDWLNTLGKELSTHSVGADTAFDKAKVDYSLGHDIATNEVSNLITAQRAGIGQELFNKGYIQGPNGMMINTFEGPDRGAITPSPFRTIQQGLMSNVVGGQGPIGTYTAADGTVYNHPLPAPKVNLSGISQSQGGGEESDQRVNKEIANEAKGFTDNPDIQKAVQAVHDAVKQYGLNSTQHTEAYNQLHMLHNQLINQMPAKYQDKTKPKTYPAIGKLEALNQLGYNIKNGQLVPNTWTSDLVPSHKYGKGFTDYYGNPVDENEERANKILSNPNIHW
jgi:hypothetical protein